MTQTPPTTAPPSSSSPPDMPGGKKKTLRIIIVVAFTCAVISVLLVVISSCLLKNRANEHGRVMCMTNLKGIGLGIANYTNENEDVYPPDIESIDIESIVNDYMDGDTTLLKCPSAKSDRDCDYFYFPPAKKTTDVMNFQKTIIACDFKGNHSGKGRNVLFTDTHVQWLSEEQFQQELQQPHNTVFAKALREAEGP